MILIFSFYYQFYRFNGVFFKYHLMKKIVVKHCDKKSDKHVQISIKNVNCFFLSFLKSITRGEQFSCDTGKLSVNSEKNRVHSSLPCKSTVLFLWCITSDLDLNRKQLWICTLFVCIKLFYLNKRKSIFKPLIWKRSISLQKRTIFHT